MQEIRYQHLQIHEKPVCVPGLARRALQKEFLAENGEKFKVRETLVEFVKCLWEQQERDFQGFGVDLLAQYRDVLLGETEAEFWEAVGVAEHCVVTKSWWDTVDAISYPGIYRPCKCGCDTVDAISYPYTVHVNVQVLQ